jgi:GT2 family glycosyltransferase
MAVRPAPPLRDPVPAETSVPRRLQPVPGQEVRRRPRATGKFLEADGQRLWVRGVTYGTFAPGPDGSQFPPPGVVDADLEAMAAVGCNALRTYTPPPRWLLDAADRRGLRVLVGVNVEPSLEGADRRDAARRVRDQVAPLAGHPAVLAFAVGNEIPAPVVRFLGRRTVERFVESCYRAVKAEDPEALVTYVNYPTTEYLRLPFLDVVAFNVFLEDEQRLSAYLARLQNLAGDRPLLLAEAGLDALRHGELTQAVSVAAQVRAGFAAGCAGTFVYAWTDDWWRGDSEVEEWAFGVTDRHRRPKPATAAVRAAFADVPPTGEGSEPRISVVVCCYNGADTLAECLAGATAVDYPDYEVIVVDDGSTDASAAIAASFPVRLISTPNRGLSAARNTGLEAATGDIVAYLDADAHPDADWLRFLAAGFRRPGVVGVGGPNLPPPGDGAVAECVAEAPGGPLHVLLTDTEAEHLPGCNMAFRRDALVAAGGFDPRFRTAGDDVDLCWRLLDAGGTLAFAPGALVWHHRRGSVRHFWRQQRGYGRAEALLENKWPQRYNRGGHLSWAGRIYGSGLTPALWRRWRVYHGTWGTEPFQTGDPVPPGRWASLPLAPEWWMVVAALMALTLVGALWTPLIFLAGPLAGLAVAVPIAQAALAAAQARLPEAARLPRRARLARRALVAWLHLIQPLARLSGRLRHGLTPWRRRHPAGRVFPRGRVWAAWSGEWQAPAEHLAAMETAVAAAGVPLRRGGRHDAWDLEVSGGLVGSARAVLGAEDHAGGVQHLRFRAVPRPATWAVATAAGQAVLALAAAMNGAVAAAALLAAGALAVFGRTGWECASALAALGNAFREATGEDQ